MCSGARPLATILREATTLKVGQVPHDGPDAVANVPGARELEDRPTRTGPGRGIPTDGAAIGVKDRGPPRHIDPSRTAGTTAINVGRDGLELRALTIGQDHYFAIEAFTGNRVSKAGARVCWFIAEQRDSPR